MSTLRSQRKAVQDYRNRLRQQGLNRFEVVALDSDRDLIRSLARCLASPSAESDRLREAVIEHLPLQPGSTGGIWKALRASPLVGAGLKLERKVTRGRKVDL
jgi:hypothetical protein